MYSDLFISIIPALFAILTAKCTSTAQNTFFERKIADIVEMDKLSNSASGLLTAISKSSISLASFVSTIFSCFLSIVIILIKLPHNYALYCIIAIVLAIVIIFPKWLWSAFSLRLDEISEAMPKVRNPQSGEKAFGKYTYAEIFNRRQYFFNSLIIILIVVGHFIPQLTKLWQSLKNLF